MTARRLLIERAARKDLAAFPPLYRDSAIGRAYLMLARRLDAGVATKDAAVIAREMRQILITLTDLAPPAVERGTLDELNERRAARMRQLAATARDGSG
jgi:hypothetical protein